MRGVTISREKKRGCGYRTAGKTGVGVYLVGGGPWVECERLPFPLGECKCCGLPKARQSRGFTWFNPQRMFNDFAEPRCELFPSCPLCSVCTPPDGEHGLMWVGTFYYPTVLDFMAEASAMGVSKRVGNLPPNFEIGKHFVYLAHPDAVHKRPELGKVPERTPGIFLAWKPSGIDLVIDDENKIPGRAHKLLERWPDARLVKVVPEGEDGEQLGLL